MIAEVLQQTEAPLGGERDPEDPVPQCQNVDRPRTVEVQEVAVRQLSVQQLLGEVEHEALLHGATGEVVEAAQRCSDDAEDRGNRHPGTTGLELPVALSVEPQAPRTTLDERLAVHGWRG